MLKLDSTVTDVKRETEGLWVDSFAFPGVRFKVRSITNADFQTASSMRALSLHRKFGKTPPAEEMAKARGELLVNHLLLDWDGLDPKYSKEEALKRLTTPSFGRVCDDIESAARFAAEPELEFIEDAAKN